MNKLLEKLGSNPQQSLRIFLRGLALFIVGIIFISLGYFYHYLWQVLGIIFFFFFCSVAAWGYLGIFASRLTKIFSRQVYQDSQQNKPDNNHTSKY